MKAREVPAVLAGRWAALLYSVDSAGVCPWVPPRPLQYRRHLRLSAEETVTRITRLVPAVTVMKIVLFHCSGIHLPLDIGGGCSCCSQQPQCQRKQVAGSAVPSPVLPIHAEIPSSSISSPSNFRRKPRMKASLCSFPSHVPSAAHLLISAFGRESISGK